MNEMKTIPVNNYSVQLIYIVNETAYRVYIEFWNYPKIQLEILTNHTKMILCE